MPKLYVVATPIGNLADMTPRAVDTLKSVGFIAAEDTRVTMKLCQVFDIHTPLVSCHRHNEEQKSGGLADRMLAENVDAALTTDAGTPCVSDPGYALVRACWERGIEVLPVPGCCAAAAAVSVSGFDCREWTFVGFPPREKKDLREKLLSLRGGAPVAVLHESPHRVTDLAAAIAETLPGAMLSVSCDLTKLHEKTIRGSAEDVLATLRDDPRTEKGEYCLVLDLHGVRFPEEPKPAADVSVEGQLADLMAGGLDLRAAQEALAGRGVRRNAVKSAALHLKKMFSREDAE